MLIDEILPQYDFTEIHTIRVKASPETAFRAIKTTSVADMSGIVKLLLDMRDLPEKMVGRDPSGVNPREPLLAEMISSGFTLLAEQSSREIVIGMIVPEKIGRVWNKASEIEVKVHCAADFQAFNNPHCLKVVANLAVEGEAEADCVTIRTESRTQALSPRAARNFRPYWAVIRPFSGLIRRLWLSSIRKRAEAIETGPVPVVD